MARPADVGPAVPDEKHEDVVLFKQRPVEPALQQGGSEKQQMSLFL